MRIFGNFLFIDYHHLFAILHALHQWMRLIHNEKRNILRRKTLCQSALCVSICQIRINGFVSVRYYQHLVDYFGEFFNAFILKIRPFHLLRPYPLSHAAIVVLLMPNLTAVVIHVVYCFFLVESLMPSILKINCLKNSAHVLLRCFPLCALCIHTTMAWMTRKPLGELFAEESKRHIDVQSVKHWQDSENRWKLYYSTSKVAVTQYKSTISAANAGSR